MAGAYKRKTDRARGKAGKWTGWYTDAEGRQRSFAGFSDKALTLEAARKRESDARQVREGLVDQSYLDRQLAAKMPLAQHVKDYAESLRAKGDTEKHVKEVDAILNRIIDYMAVFRLDQFNAATVQMALGRVKSGKSARTANKYRANVKAWLKWLYEANRIREVPRGLASVPRYNEAADRRRERRALTAEELEALLRAAEAGPPLVATRGEQRGPRPKVWITGAERAAVYRLAAGTGFRAEEVRTLTPERFKLDGTTPTITVLARHSKNGKEAVQPITTELAEALKPFVHGKGDGKPWMAIPGKLAGMLRHDLEAAGIAAVNGSGVVDFHALRMTFITGLVARGLNPRVIQALARHSTITLTMGTYCKPDETDVGNALRGT